MGGIDFLTPAGFQAAANVSRETLARLELYAALLRKWQGAINLVSRDSLNDVWRRHMLDSAQLYPLIPPGIRTLVDLGSGAGFPGLVLAALGVPDVHLVESDSRKCAFLREAARAMGLAITVHTRRIEEMAPFGVDVITARALAPLADLLDLGERFLLPHTICLFLKGRGVDEELTRVAERWNMTVMREISASDPSGTILRLEHIHREPAS
jgi:16S rRNA (guanine527-N7)-methyltransferase